MLLIMPLACMAQHYTITRDELDAPLIERKGNKIDLSDPNSEKEAKIIFTGLKKADHDKINVLYGDQRTIPVTKRTASSDDRELEFDILIDIKEKNNPSFFIFYDSDSIGKVSFIVSGFNKLKNQNGDTEEENDTTFNSFINVLTSANFIGNNKFLSNLTPAINLGGIVSLRTFKSKKEKPKGTLTWDLDINPYLGGEIDTKDSVSFIPALMLYGRGGITVNNYFNYKSGKTIITLMPIGFGLKFIPNLQDSGNVVLQHNLRGGMSIQYSNIFLLSGQMTYGWHNLTSDSKKNYENIFGAGATDIKYITVTGQFALKGKNEEILNYIFLEWRSLLFKNLFPGFSNNTILTMGLRKNLSITSSSPFRAAKSDGKNETNRKSNRRIQFGL